MSAVAVKPRLGFLGVGWIGRNRLDAVATAGVAEVTAVADPAVPDALESLDDLLARDLDGVVIATPSALHAEQAVAALDAGVAVFCQKPLARSAREAEAVVSAARAADRLLAVDLSYRFTRAAQEVRAAVRALAPVHVAELTFHNAYGPDRPWFYDRGLAGGGCLVDLGTHLVDLALWTLDWPTVTDVSGRTLSRNGHEVEDYAVAHVGVAGGAILSISCSWNLPAGADCEIGAAFYGGAEGAELHNVGGSFYDFDAMRFSGTHAERLATPPDDWGGRAICEWACRLARGERYDPEIEHAVAVADVLDRVYAAST